MKERDYVMHNGTFDPRTVSLTMSVERRQEDLRKLAAFDWAEANRCVVTFAKHNLDGRSQASVWVSGNMVSGYGETALEAIEALRAKVEPTAKGDGITDDTEAVQRGAPLAPGETKTAPDKRVPAGSYRAAKSCTECGGEGVHKMSCSSQHTHKHDKRVPAELWSDLRDNLFSGDVELRERLESCPDITDEPATLHQTAQAVLDAATRWIPPDVPRGDDVALCEAWSSWDMAGRPTVVPGVCQTCAVNEARLFELECELADWKELISDEDEDAATLAALRRCRELGVYHMWSGARWCVWSNGTGTFHAEDLPEALAAYEAAQAPKVEPTPRERLKDSLEENMKTPTTPGVDTSGVFNVAKVEPAAAQESAHKPDSGCMTTPDGDCHGSGCMHNPTPDKRVPAELLAKAVMHAKAPPCSIRTRLTREQAIKILDMITDRDNAWEMAIEAVVGWPDDESASRGPRCPDKPEDSEP